MKLQSLEIIYEKMFQYTSTNIQMHILYIFGIQKTKWK